MVHLVTTLPPKRLMMHPRKRSALDRATGRLPADAPLVETPARNLPPVGHRDNGMHYCPDVAAGVAGSQAHASVEGVQAPEVLGGRYELRGILGRGGMAEVRDGWDTRLDRPVAVKLLHPAFTVQPDSRRRFESRGTGRRRPEPSRTSWLCTTAVSTPARRSS